MHPRKSTPHDDAILRALAVLDAAIWPPSNRPWRCRYGSRRRPRTRRPRRHRRTDPAPLAYGFPDGGGEHVKDQFLMGDDLLVAPMVTKGTARTVQIPHGTWKADDGTPITGPIENTFASPLVVCSTSSDNSAHEQTPTFTLAVLLLAPMTQVAAEKLPDGVWRSRPVGIAHRTRIHRRTGAGAAGAAGVGGRESAVAACAGATSARQAGGAGAAMESAVPLQAVAGSGVETRGHRERAEAVVVLQPVSHAGEGNVVLDVWRGRGGIARQTGVADGGVLLRRGRPRVCDRHSSHARAGARGHSQTQVRSRGHLHERGHR